MASLRLGIDGVSRATPLDTFKTSLHAGHSVQQVLQLPVYGGVLAGLGWQWVNIAGWQAAFPAVAEGDPLAYPGQLPC